MPGLAGIIGDGKTADLDVRIGTMVSAMHYEEFYERSIYKDVKRSIHVGWTRQHKSRNDNFPLNDSENNALFIAGEIFSDSFNLAAFLNNYEQEPKNSIDALNGSFCGLLVNSRSNEIVLFNDRYGMHRVFIYEDRDAFYFASEAKALLSIMPVVGFDPIGLGEFLTCGCTLGSHSLYDKISILPPASFLVFKAGKLTYRGSYFDRRNWAEQDVLSEDAYIQEFNNLFGQAVKRCSSGILPIGVSLTGGLDTRMVMACLEKECGPFPCYTFGSMYRDTFDVKVAQQVAQACGQSHETLVLGGDFLQKFSFYLEKAVEISDGYIGLSGAAELFSNSSARHIAPVRLTGNYGSELLRGARAFKAGLPSGGFLSPEMAPFLKMASETFKDLEPIDQRTFALFKQAPLQGYGRLATENSQVFMRSPFIDNDLVRLSYRAPLSLQEGNELSIAVIANYHADLLNITSDRGVLGNDSRFRQLIRRLEKEALFKAEYWTGRGMPMWLSPLSATGMMQYLNSAFIGRHKFQHFYEWTKGNIAEFIRETINHGIKELSAYFQIDRVIEMIETHISGKRNYLDQLDKLLSLSLVQTKLLKSRVKGNVSKL